MDPLPPVNAVPLFPEERAALLDMLSSLTGEQWALPTVCPGWSIKDIAAHLLADDLGRLSGGRDRYPGSRFEPSNADSFEAELRDFINRQNEAWVAAARRLSPHVIMELLQWSGLETQAYFESLDPDAMSNIGVSWAGEEKSANWFDLAREYSERWIHQAQIREAAGAPMLYDDNLFLPLLNTIVRALPHSLRDTDAPDGAQVRFTITGVGAQGLAPLRYDLVRRSAQWRLVLPLESDPAASVTLDADTAWRLFTRGIPRADAVARAHVDGNPTLAHAVFDTLAIIA